MPTPDFADEQHGRLGGSDTLELAPRANEGGGNADHDITLPVDLGRRLFGKLELGRGVERAALPFQAKILPLRRVVAPGVGVLAEDHAARRAHGGAFDFAEDHGLAEQLCGVARGIADLEPAHRFAGETVARNMLGRFR